MINFNRTDFKYEDNLDKLKILYQKNSINVYSFLNKNNYRIIKYNIIDNNLKDIIKNELNFFIKKLNKNKSTLIVGLGNDSFTADSLGPRVLKNIKANAYLEKANIKINGTKISCIEPGVLGQTGIDVKTIIKSIIDKIKPDYLITIDSFICKSVDNLEKTVEISNLGITPGSGIHGINSCLNKKSLNIPVIVIGVPCALEINIKNNNYIVSSNNIDRFIIDISKTIGDAINELLYFS